MVGKGRGLTLAISVAAAFTVFLLAAVLLISALPEDEGYALRSAGWDWGYGPDGGPRPLGGDADGAGAAPVGDAGRGASAGGHGADAAAGSVASGPDTVGEGESCLIEATVRIEGDAVRVDEALHYGYARTAFAINLPSMNEAVTVVESVEYLGGDGAWHEAVGAELGEASISFVSGVPSDGVRVTYSFTVGRQRGNLTMNDEAMFLTNFLATPCAVKDGKYVKGVVSAFGDPYLSPVCDYRVVVVDVKGVGFEVISSALVTEGADGDVRSFRLEGLNMRDLPVVILLEPDKVDYAREEIGGVGVISVNCWPVGSAVAGALAFGRERIGEYDRGELYVVRAPIKLKGMEFCGMIFMSDAFAAEGADFNMTLIHEVFHQWFYSMVGTDQIGEPFMDEGLANFLAYAVAGGTVRTGYDEGELFKAIKGFPDARSYNDAVYNQGFAYFAGMRDALGDGAFYSMLRRICGEKRHGILYHSELMGYYREAQADAARAAPG
ncbi:MAG: hypothetical protein FWE70_06690 [Oscillospiraceae bacterium]|nr:hypothetical protein [Oscillospiraceae bacterium]